MPPGITGTDVTSQPSQPADENTLKITNSDRTYTTRLSARTKPRVAPGQSQNETRPLSENNVPPGTWPSTQLPQSASPLRGTSPGRLCWNTGRSGAAIP